tara:strand:+ start:756 stop:1334 length:579 start_codon:yes stop_codon:yes gene_type:complete
MNTKTNENNILNTIYSMIESENLSEEKINDILILLKSALQKNNTSLNISLIIKIYTTLTKSIPDTQKINNLLFINFHSLYIFIMLQEKNQKETIRIFLLLLENYLMNNIKHILKEQIELILFIIQEFIKKHNTLFFFQYGFLYLKLHDLVSSKKRYYHLKKELYITKELILEICPKTKEGNELKQFIITKTI